MRQIYADGGTGGENHADVRQIYLVIWDEYISFFNLRQIYADGGTGGENHADVLQEGLVLYLEVREQEDNLMETD